MVSKTLLITMVIAYVEARFGQENVPIAAISAVQGGSPGAAATIAGATISDLLGAANSCAKLSRADDIVSQLGGGADAIAAAIGLVAAEKNTNPFANGNVQNVCGDASLPATAELRGITPLIDPAVDTAGAAAALSKKTAATPENADGMSVFDLMVAAGLGDLVTSQNAAGGAAAGGAAAGGNNANAGNANQNQNKGNAAGNNNNQNAGNANNNAGNSTQSAVGNANGAADATDDCTDEADAAAGNAKQNAGNAKSNAGNANQKAGNAKSNAGNANQKAGNAKSNAGNANQKAGNAKNNAGNANNNANGAANATDGCTDEAAAAGNAKQSASNAKNNAGNAKNNTGNANQKAGNANQNAGNANKGNNNNAGNANQNAGNNNNNAGNATAGAAAGGATAGAADFGKCTPTITFQGGEGNRPATEFTFQIADPVARGGQGEALNPNIITNALCNQLTNVCGASAAGVSKCLDAKAQVQAAGTRNKSTADLFNTAMGFAGAVTNPKGGPDDVPAAGAAAKAARMMRRGLRL